MTISHATQSTNCASGNHLRTIEPKKYPKPEDSAEINSFKKIFTRNRLLVGKTYASFAYKHRSVSNAPERCWEFQENVLVVS